jgi:hypothetical protein
MQSSFYVYNLLIPMTISIFLYYLTLPGSIMYPKKDYKKPTVYDTIISWLSFYFIFLIILYFYQSRMINNENTCSYLNLLSNMLCGKNNY